MTLTLYPFRYFDRVRGRWIKARYLSTMDEIAARHERWEIIGRPNSEPATRRCLTKTSAPRVVDHLPPEEDEPPPDHGPTPDPPPVEQPPPVEDQLERFFVPLFLRRYVTWCARHRRFAAMNGAARLYASISMTRALP